MWAVRPAYWKKHHVGFADSLAGLSARDVDALRDASRPGANESGLSPASGYGHSSWKNTSLPASCETEGNDNLSTQQRANILHSGIHLNPTNVTNNEATRILTYRLCIQETNTSSELKDIGLTRPEAAVLTTF